MTSKRMKTVLGQVAFLLLVILTSCSVEPAVGIDPTATPTPTPVLQAVPPTQTETPSNCAGLAGQLEVQVLVGPADVVGLEPFTVGNVSFAVTTDGAPYIIQGSGRADYSEILTEEWGTYAVTMNLDFMVSGNCEDDGNEGLLFLVLEMSGSQMVEVTAEGFHGEYPWQGTQAIDLQFPIEEGATVSGEGYIIVLHVN